MEAKLIQMRPWLLWDALGAPGGSRTPVGPRGSSKSIHFENSDINGSKRRFWNGLNGASNGSENGAENRAQYGSEIMSLGNVETMKTVKLY